MQDIPLGASFGARFTTTNAVGANANADALPTWRVLTPGNDTAVLSGNCRKTAALTGCYEAYFTVASPCAEGSIYEVVVSATVGGVENDDVEVGCFRAVMAGVTPQPTLQEIEAIALGTPGPGTVKVTLRFVDQNGNPVRNLPVTLAGVTRSTG